MKRWRLISLGLGMAILLGSTYISSVYAQGRGQGFRPCPYAPYQCPITGVCKPMTITGTVSRVFTETLDDKAYPGMAIKVDSKDKGQVHVHLGPVWYLERQEFDLSSGQEVTVQGICVDEAGKIRLVAASVTAGNNVLMLRDLEGRPMWEAWRRR
ncbi:hypothetical protein [Desulfobacca acetoxidans]